ncbi:VPS4-associated protein 1 [Mycotypha africana]|uniref:VPS4-associated protein 1 n=1 Tax=Mycotypha africana TaxID=64632 RepID=UPI002300A808|nr:VPS4-associated protein 1 [Mycotypha africana]KAI8977483.1 VPS4-associated protein 1 [Mycotypha africana]
MVEKRLQNLYVARLVTSERPCFVCNKFTHVVLTSADGSNADWFYTCKSHLGDFNFCSKIGGTSPKTTAKQQQEKKEASLANRPPESDSIVDLVSNIGSAWKSWRASSSKKSEAEEKEKDDKKPENDNEKDNEKKEKGTEKDDASSTTSTVTKSPAASPSPSSSPQQPVRFVIQRDYFFLRQREYMKKQQKKEASEKLKTLQFPEVPKTIPINKDNTATD